MAASAELWGREQRITVEGFQSHPSTIRLTVSSETIQILSHLIGGTWASMDFYSISLLRSQLVMAMEKWLQISRNEAGFRFHKGSPSSMHVV